MPRVTYVPHDGEGRTIDVPVGWSVMDGAVKNGVAGIVAECGGSCACATCHVFVDPDWLGRLPPPSGMERDLLECTAEPAQDNSRLSCQLRVDASLDGLVVRMPATQT